MNRILPLLMCIVVVVSGCASLQGTFQRPVPIAEDGTAQCRIVVSDAAPPSTQYAARELQHFLQEVTGAGIAIVSDKTALEPHDILLGSNAHLEAVTGGRIDPGAMGQEEYVLRTVGGHLVIAGGEPRGTLYGVYGLLEDHLGCRWFTPDAQRIPQQAHLSIGPLDEHIIPRLEYREPFVMDCFDGDWAARNRMNSSAARLEERHGGKVTYFGFVHTFQGLLPPDKYFDEHPEYYSLIKGARLKERSQLCCTNEDVIRLVTEEVRKRMREHPECTVFSVSQNDWHNYCECEKCTALAEAEGTQMAPVLHLVNRVAAAVAEEFPDKLVDTLAYQYTRKAPKTMRPEPNVVIRLCSIECCFAHPFVTCDSEENKSFVRDVEDWSQRCNRLWVWNYNTSFSNYLMPYPNLRVRDDNIRFYADHNVTGIFEQDVYTTLNGELSPLSGYLNAKLLWNPDYDENTAINEFLDGVYGPAAPSIRKYIDLIHDKVQKENLHMDIWIGPEHPLLTTELLEEANRLWDEAEAAVADTYPELDRVRAARLSVEFATIEHMRREGLKIYEIDHANRTMRVRPEFRARVERFLDDARRYHVTKTHENNGDIEIYRKALESYQDVTSAPPTPAVAVESPQAGLLFKEYDAVWEKLPDFGACTPIQDGVAQAVNLEVTSRREALGLLFEGFFLAPEDGIYLFHCTSNDGSKLYLDGKVIVDNDGLHKYSTKSGIVALDKGYHPMRVEYFESGGQEGLEVALEGPGMEKQPVPAKLLWHAGK